MARVYQDGFEFNSVTSNISTWETISGSPTISTTTVRSGTYSGRISSLSSGAAKGWVKKWLASTADGPYWGRVYIYVHTRPSATNHIISFNSASGTAGNSERGKITLESNGTLVLREASGTAVGSPSGVLALDTWYCVETKFDRTPASGSEILEARLAPDDGSTPSVFATSSSLTLPGGAFAFSVGGNLDLEAQTTGDWFFDDIAINDSAGSFQNSYPGQGKILHLRPNASGDSNQFTTQTGGTAGSSNNFTRVNQVTPDDATTFNGDSLLNDEDLYNIDNSGIGSSDNVNVVMVGARFRNNTADATTRMQLEIEKTSSGTKTSSANIIPNTTGWNTNDVSSPRNYPIVTYQDPDGAAWTQTTLDSIQIGMKMGLVGVNRIDVTTIWATIDYTPSTGTTTQQPLPGLARITIITSRTIQSITRITTSSARVILGLARLTKETPKTIQGKANIIVGVSQTITGKSRITVAGLQTKTGKASILRTVFQTITGVARITKSTSQTTAGKSRITVSTIQTIQGKADILRTTTRNQTGLARLTLTILQTIQGRSRITQAVTWTITGLSRITAVTALTIAGKALITATTLRTIPGLSRITKSTSQTIIGVAAIVSGGVTITTKPIMGVARIASTTVQTIIGVSRIQKMVSQTQTGKARITAIVAKTITGVARLTITGTKTITGVARISSSTSRNIFGLARVTAIISRVITGVAQLVGTTTRNQTGLANINRASTKTITGLSTIIKIHNNTKPVVSVEGYTNRAGIDITVGPLATIPQVVAQPMRRESQWQDESVASQQALFDDPVALFDDDEVLFGRFIDYSQSPTTAETKTVPIRVTVE